MERRADGRSLDARTGAVDEARYEVLFRLLRPLLNPPIPPTGKKPPTISALKESGPAEL